MRRAGSRSAQRCYSSCIAAISSLLTATAHGLGAAVLGRGLQGIGAGGLVPATLALVADRWPPERRSLPLGVVGAVQEAGAVLGPLAGAAEGAAILWVTTDFDELATMAHRILLCAGGLGDDRRYRRRRHPGGPQYGACLVPALRAVLGPDA